MLSSPTIETVTIGGTLEIPRLISGLWQLAGGHDKNVDITDAAKAMDPLISAGLDCFDMADHYGDAELIIGKHNTTSSPKSIALTKWCPAENGITSFENAEAAVDLALNRMKQKQIALLQYHIWDYTDPTYIHNLSHLLDLQKSGKIKHIGLTNTNTAHLSLLLDSGFPIVSNQISVSVLDRRFSVGPMSKLCLEREVAILAYGILLGGFLSEKWVGVPEPLDEWEGGLNWSLRKYKRFIHAAGGWAAFQTVLGALDTIAKKYNIKISTVAIRYVLDIPGVTAVILGSRLTPSSAKHIPINLGVFSLALDEEDRKLIAKAQEGLRDIPWDCGDEYRKEPFLTARGNLGDHLKERDGKAREELEKAVREGKRIEFSSGSPWESVANYTRALCYHSQILISGTTAHPPISLPTPNLALGGSSAYSQTIVVFDIISRALKALGGDLKDIVRTRIVVQKAEDIEAVARAHGYVFEGLGIRPTDMLTLGRLVGDEFLVEVEAEAVVGLGEVVRIGG